MKKFKIAKTDKDKQYVFGWAQVAKDENGNQIEDSQGDVVEPEDLEEAAYYHVLNFRSTGESHDPGMRKKGKLIESVMLTKEKQEAMGIPPGFVKEGWWVGYHIDDPETWLKIKNGIFKMFSVEGVGERTPIQGIAKNFSDVISSYAIVAGVKEPIDLLKENEFKKTNSTKFKELIEKYNPYHDSKGRFTSARSATTISANRTIKGGPWGEKNSLSKHLDGNGKITKDRIKLYNQIVNNMLEGIEKPNGTPTIDFMGGGGGSGKGYTISSGIVQVPEGKKAIHIDSDQIKLKIPEFSEIARNNDLNVAKRAADYVHEESSIITNMVIDVATKKGLNIVMDGVASNPEKMKKQVDAAKKEGYVTKAHYISAPTETAVQDNYNRFYNNTNVNERRMVPEEVIRNAHRDVSKNFNELSKIYDEVEVVTNDRVNKPEKIAYKGTDGKMVVVNQVEYDKFLNKANENIPN